MRALLAIMLVLAIAQTGFAREPEKAEQWSRLPRNSRLSFMTGAAAGVRAYALTQPGTPLPARIRVDQAVATMDRLARDPMFARQPLMSVASKAILSSQDAGVPFQEKGTVIRDAQFDQKILFDRPWLMSFNLDSLVPTEMQGPKPTFARTWLACGQQQKEFFLKGFGDMVAQSCLDKYGDTKAGNACLRPLLPLPPDIVLAQMDGIYRDKQYADQQYDAVIRAALLKMTGGDWQSLLNSK